MRFCVRLIKYGVCMKCCYYIDVINTSYKRSNGQKIWFWVDILNLCKLTTFAYLDCSIILICCSGWEWESVPTNKVSVAILSRSNHRLTGLYQQFEHSLSDGPVLQHAQDERISVYLLQSYCRVGELIHQNGLLERYLQIFSSGELLPELL